MEYLLRHTHKEDKEQLMKTGQLSRAHGYTPTVNENAFMSDNRFASGPVLRLEGLKHSQVPINSTRLFRHSIAEPTF